jgi:hypothetical protein
VSEAPIECEQVWKKFSRRLFRWLNADERPRTHNATLVVN